MLYFQKVVKFLSIYHEKNRRTKQSIQDAFLHTLTIKPFDAITIGDITKVANINRGTFYLHYLDKYDLLNRIEEQLFVDLGNYIDQLQTHYLAQPFFEIEQEALAHALFAFIEKHAQMLKTLLSENGRAGFHLRFKDAFSKKVSQNLEVHHSYYNQLNVPSAYFLSFITSAFLGLIEQWIQNGLDKTPEEMTTIYLNIISFIKNK